MSEYLVKKSEFAQMCGVRPAAITKALKEGSVLPPALVGNRIDANHPAALQYRDKSRGTLEPTNSPEKRGYERAEKRTRKTPAKKAPAKKAAATNKAPTKKAPTKKAQAAKKAPAEKPAAPEKFAIPENILEFQDWSLRQVLEQFGTATRFVDFLNATTKIEAIYEKRVKHAKESGDLVSRDLVKIGIIEPMNVAHRRLLTDTVSTIVSEVYDRARAEFTVEECELFARDQVSSILTPMKDQMQKTLKGFEK